MVNDRGVVARRVQSGRVSHGRQSLFENVTRITELSQASLVGVQAEDVASLGQATTSDSQSMAKSAIA